MKKGTVSYGVSRHFKLEYYEDQGYLIVHVGYFYAAWVPE